MLNVLDMLSSFSDVRVPWRFLSSFHSDSSIKESDQERQRNAEQVEDLQKQLSTAAAEACLHWPAHVSLFGVDCMTKMRMANRET